MNKQEIYDKVCKHLARQKTRAMIGSSCAYRTVDGKRCAVGCLIPYHVWKSDVGEFHNSDSVYAISLVSPWAKKNLWASMDLLDELQDAHDDEAHTAFSLRHKLIAIAKCFRIKPGAEQYIRTWNP